MSIDGIIKAAIGFGLLIFVHELGHFLAARWMGVRVEVFSLGFGKALWKKKRGNTVYQLSAIPFGGYVKMLGEEDDSSKPTAPDSFVAKSVWRRCVILVAGVAMNILFGFLVFMLAYGVGVPSVPAVAGEISPGSPAWNAGIERGDTITAINNIKPPVDFEDLRVTVMLTGKEEKLHLRILRNGQELDKTLVPEYLPEVGLKSAGIGMPFSMALPDPKRLPAPEEGMDYSVLYSKGAAEGDVIVAAAIEGGEQVPVASPGDLDELVDMAGGKPVELFLQRAGAAEPRSVKLDLVPVGKPTWLGIRFGSARVKAVKPGSWADKAGLLPEDRIAAINGRLTRSPSEIEAALLAGVAREAATPELATLVGRTEQPESLVVIRGAERITLPLEEATAVKLGGALAFYPDLTVDLAWPAYPADKAGMQPGDVIIALNGEPVADHAAFSEKLSKSSGKPLQLTWKRDDKEMTASMLQQKRWTLPVAFEPPQNTVRAGLLGSVALGTRKTFQWIMRTYATLRGLISGQIHRNYLSGPLSIGYVTYVAAKEGIGRLLYLLGFVSINLGVINLLPIPVLDGGHVLFAVIEKLRGKPVAERLRAIATYGGLSLILGIAALALWNDVHNLILSRFL